jgi:RNA polymerase sigma-70 factor, ECF subfamily
MLRVLESIKRYRFRGVAFSAWVFRIARNRVIDLKRRQSRHKEVDVPETLVAPHANTHQQAELALNRDNLRVAMSYLTEEQRQVMLLRFIEGFDNASVSRIVGRSESAVKSLQHRALNSMRRKLNGQDGRRGRKKKAAAERA